MSNKKITPKDQRPNITEALKLNKICRDFYEGATKVKTDDYLPIYEGESDTTHKIRVSGTALINMFAPVVDGITGMVMSKPPHIEGYDKLSGNVDMNGNTLSVFCKECIKYSLVDGITYIALQKSEKENRIYFKRYRYENLIMELLDDNGELEGYVFKDTIEAKDGDFGYEERERYIVYKAGEGQIWYTGKDGKFSKQDEWTNEVNVVPVVDIVTGYKKKPSAYISRLRDLADMNSVHLTTKTHISSVLLKVGNIQTIFFGEVGDNKLVLGIDDALTFTDKTKEGLEYVEAKGTGVVYAQNEIKTIEESIDKLTYGIFDLKSANTVVEAKGKDKKTSSILTDIAEELSSKINILYPIYAELSKVEAEKDANIEFRTDFAEEHLSIDVAFKMLTENEMSRETYYNVWQTGKLPKDFDIKEEAERIEKEESEKSGAGIDD